MRRMQIEKLKRVIPPPEHPINCGSKDMWDQVRASCGVPDRLFRLFNAYGTAFFYAFDAAWQVVGCMSLLNVFDKPMLAEHERIGLCFVESKEYVELPYVFFPEAVDGLFPVFYDCQKIHLLIDPKDDSKVYTADNGLYYFKKHDLSLFEFIFMAIEGKDPVQFMSIDEKASVSHVKAFTNWKEGYKEKFKHRRADRRRK